jgi:hypothetical protein
MSDIEHVPRKYSTRRLADLLLIASVNESMEIPAGVEFAEREIGEIVCRCRENKISLARIVHLLRRLGCSCPKELEREADLDEEVRLSIRNGVAYISGLLQGNNIPHVFIKLNRAAGAVISDIDILIPEPEYELDALRALQQSGFACFQARPLHHPLKINAVRYGQGRALPSIVVDFYPDILWNSKRVHDGELVMRRSRSVNFDGLSIRVPSAEDEIYMLATHACHHLRVRMADLLHGFLILQEGEHGMDWRFVQRVARFFATTDDLYIFSQLLQQYLMYCGHSEISLADLWSTERSPWFSRAVVSRIARNLGTPPSFPINLPMFLYSFGSSRYHLANGMQAYTSSEVFRVLASYYWMCGKLIVELA